MRVGRRTWQKIYKGWGFAATVGQISGIAIYLGPLCIDIQPPAPEWAKGF